MALTHNASGPLSFIDHPNQLIFPTLNQLADLHLITNKLLNTAEDAYRDLWTLTRELYDFLFRITAVDPDESSSRQNGRFLDKGHAIGLTWAAMCIHDIMRTKKFMDGLYQAVVEVQKEKQETPVHILYAGTGPFATLILPLLARFSSQQIRFTLLEVNLESYDCLSKLVAILDLSQYVRNLHLADATTWQVAADEPVDIFLTETMLRALKSEPQVAICLNILPQLPANTRMVPEEVILTVGSMSFGQSSQEDDLPQPVIVPLANVFNLNRTTIMQNAEAYKLSATPYNFPATAITIPSQEIDDLPSLAIFTEIIVYQEVILKYNESGLTMAQPLNHFRTGTPSSLTFQYRVDRMPGLHVTPSEVS